MRDFGRQANRDKAFAALTCHPEVQWGVSVLDHTVIDEINILQAALLAMANAVDDMALRFPAAAKPDFALVDGPHLPPTLAIPAEPVIKVLLKPWCGTHEWRERG